MTTFYTCCNKKYEDFIPIFVHSILYHNTDAVVEVGIEESIQSEAIEFIKSDRFKLNKVIFDRIKIKEKIYGVCSNIVRFITIPKSKNEYVYISDVDIITLQKDITQIHLNDMMKTGLNYSNIVRPNQKKLTGLHFTKWDSYYPIPDFEDLADNEMLNHDEVFLYYLVAKKNIINETNTFRPIHGIHISPNRTKLGNLSGWKNQWIEYRNSKEFLFLEKLFSDRIKNFIKRIDYEIN